MRTALAAAVVIAAAAVAAVVASCTVHRVSDRYACTETSQCDDGRVCEQGFCIAGGGSSACPTPCDSCDLDERTCKIECSTGNPCGAVHCPIGFDCTIRCNSAGACGDIDCATATRCDVDCSGGASCGNLNCGGGECAVRCAGAGACPSIDCAVSCKCDVDCNNPAAACPHMSCPQLLDPCTEQGSAGAPCSSNELGCDRCF